MTGWHAVGASVRGGAHEATGAPNQDAFAVARCEDGSSALFVALSDGHGGSRYVRSDRGARLAVEVAIACASQWWSTERASCANGTVTAEVRRTLVPAIVDRWRAAVERDLERSPLSDEPGGLDVNGLADAVVAYGATLLLALLDGDIAVFAQLGDGDVVCAMGPDGAAVLPVPGDDRLVGGRTTSLCLPTAVDDVRVASLPTSTVETVILATDGYGNSFADADWANEVAADLGQLLEKQGIDYVGAALEGWLMESAVAGGDDVTVVVASRTVPDATTGTIRIEHAGGAV